MANGKLRTHRQGNFSNGALRNSMRVLAIEDACATQRSLQAQCVHSRRTLDNSDPSVGTISRCLDCSKPLSVAGIVIN